MERMYIIDDSLEFNKREFVMFLLDLIEDNDLAEMLGFTKNEIERRVNNRPFCIGKRLGLNVVTFLK